MIYIGVGNTDTYQRSGKKTPYLAWRPQTSSTLRIKLVTHYQKSIVVPAELTRQPTELFQCLVVVTDDDNSLIAVSKYEYKELFITKLLQN